VPTDDVAGDRLGIILARALLPGDGLELAIEVDRAQRPRDRLADGEGIKRGWWLRRRNCAAVSSSFSSNSRPWGLAMARWSLSLPTLTFCLAALNL
jgi:hypothetical protein